MSQKFNRIGVLILAALLLIPSLAFAQPAVSFALKTADQYRNQARYPSHSWPLEAGQADPVTNERVPSPITARGPQAGDPSLTVWPAKMSFLPGEAVQLFARVDGAVPTSVRAEIVDDQGTVVATVDYRPRPGAAPLTATVRDLPTPELAASYLVRVEAELPDGTRRNTATGFLLSNPWADLTGRYRDRLEDGNVVIAAQVKVEKAGRFHLIGTLTTPSGDPIGSAQTAVELEPGTHWVDLSFYGLMFQDRGVAGPYVLGSLALTTTGGMPNALGNVIERAHTTRAYPLDQLTRAPYNAPELLETARRLELEAALAAARAEGSQEQ